MFITEIRTHNLTVAKHAPLTTTLTLYLFSIGFNTLCTALQSFPNTDTTRHTHVTAGDRQHILNTHHQPPRQRQNWRRQQQKKDEEWQQQHHIHHIHHQQPWYRHKRLDNGPNDTSRVVWAIRWVFFFHRVFFYTKQYILLLWIY